MYFALLCVCFAFLCVCVYFAKSATRCEGGAKCAWWRPGRSAPHCQLANYFLLFVEVALEVEEAKVALEVVLVVEVELKVVVVEVALEVVEAEVVHLLSDSKLFSSQLAANCAPVAAQMYKRLDIPLLYKEEKRMLQMCKRLDILYPKREIVANV